MREFVEAKEFHATFGHAEFVQYAEHNDKNSIFMYNVCADVRCAKRSEISTELEENNA
jgi:hypothetical protein